MAYIIKFVNTLKILSDIEIKKLVNIKEIPKWENFENCKNYEEKKDLVKVKICPKTMRPYYHIQNEFGKIVFQKF